MTNSKSGTPVPPKSLLNVPMADLVKAVRLQQAALDQAAADAATPDPTHFTDALHYATHGSRKARAISDAAAVADQLIDAAMAKISNAQHAAAQDAAAHGIGVMHVGADGTAQHIPYRTVMALNPTVLIEGMASIITMALDGAALRLNDPDPEHTSSLASEASDRDMIWAVASLDETLRENGGEIHPLLAVWLAEHQSLIAAVRISIEADPVTPVPVLVQAQAREETVSLDGDALVAAICPLLDPARRTIGHDFDTGQSCILLKVSPAEMDAILLAASPAFTFTARLDEEA